MGPSSMGETDIFIYVCIYFYFHCKEIKEELVEGHKYSGNTWKNTQDVTGDQHEETREWKANGVLVQSDGRHTTPASVATGHIYTAKRAEQEQKLYWWKLKPTVDFHATFHVGNCVLPSPFFPMLSMHLQPPTIVPKKYRAAWRRYIAGTRFCFKGLIYAMSSSCRILTSKTSWATRVCLGFSSCKWRGQWKGTILLWTIYKIASPIWRCRWRSMAENRWNLSWCC